ncbi:MAG: ankyrin repeat domain-containing protein [Bacteroidota bacterium]
MIKKLIETLDFEGLKDHLSKQPELANEGFTCDERNPAIEHPLHRICDGVFMKVYSDLEGVELAKIFLSFGAKVDGWGLIEKRDSPLVAAASLHADEVAFLYIDHGANIHHRGCHGGTALHWAAWCGRDKLVKRLIREGSDIHKNCIDFEGTPLLWAVHGYKFGGEVNRSHQIECVRLLLEAGADKTTTNIEGTKPIGFLNADDVDMIRILEGA